MTENRLTPDIGAVWWIKRDLRLYDNPALTEAAALAAQSGLPLLPFFLFEPSVLSAPEASSFHIQAQCQALADLRQRLKTRHGTETFAAVSQAVAALEALHRRHPFMHLVSHRGTGTEVTYRRDRAVAVWCRRRGVTWTEPPQVGWVRELCGASPLPINSLLTPDAGLEQRQAVTEPLAWATLRGFLSRRAARYAGGISSPVTAFQAGSRLSAHLAWGTVSARAVQHKTHRRLAELTGDASPEARALRSGLRAFGERLGWRDHFAQRLEDEPGIEFHMPHPLYEDLPSVTGGEAEERLRRLLAGQTGFPLVDACLRCAAATGFLNFRMRALVTSFACHGLRLDWRAVMAPLAALWTDYEPGIHVSQVQMQAGVVGTNTIRVYSPAKQLRDQDPALTFTRAWLPELTGAADDLVRALGVPEGPARPGYAAPLVNFAAESRQMKDVLYGRRDSPEGEEAAAIVQRRHGSRRSRPKRPAGRRALQSPSEPVSS